MGARRVPSRGALALLLVLLSCLLLLSASASEHAAAPPAAQTAGQIVEYRPGCVFAVHAREGGNDAAAAAATRTRVRTLSLSPPSAPPTRRTHTLDARTHTGRAR